MEFFLSGKYSYVIIEYYYGKGKGQMVVILQRILFFEWKIPFFKLNYNKYLQKWQLSYKLTNGSIWVSSNVIIPSIVVSTLIPVEFTLVG